MSKSRLEAFSDGVIAIVITIMVLEMKVPHSTDLESLLKIWPVFFSYTLSFIFVGIYWNNHHHLFQVVHQVRGSVLWANLHLLFWISLFPFFTAWMGENHFAMWPVALYGVDLLLAACAYYILVRTLLRIHEKGSHLANAIGSDRKGKISLLLYLLAIPLAFYYTWAALAIYVLVAVIWLLPDRRIERLIMR